MMSNPIIGPGNPLPGLTENCRTDFSVLYDTYAPALLGIIQKAIPDKQQGYDVLQLAFQDIWKQIDNYQPEKLRFFTWLYQITCAAITAYKRETEGQAANVRSYIVQHPMPPGQSVNNFIRRLH